MKARFCPLVVSVLLLGNWAIAADWPHWRGPEFNGGSLETGLPVTFSPTNNVKWAAELPGPSAATPIISGNRVFLSSTDLRTKTLLALALDRKTGQELWRREISPGFARDNRSNLASPSPVTDGQQVFFLYGNGDLAAFDFTGKSNWTLNLEKRYGPLTYQWTYGASPTLFDGRLFIQVLRRDVPVNGRGRSDGPNESFLLALNPVTGRELWRQVRPSDARAESQEAYSTPIPVAVDGVPQMLVVGADCITGHGIANGEELWRWGTWNLSRNGNSRLIPSPVSDGKVALALTPRGVGTTAIKLGGHGLLNTEAVAWQVADREIGSDVSTPAYYDGRFYLINSDKRLIARLDPATGKADWVGQLESRSKIESSPTAADGKLYFQSHSGEVFVVGTGDTFEILHRVDMGDAGDRDTRASIGVSGGELFIRTAAKLYCVGREI